MFGKIFESMYDGTLASDGPWQALVTFQQMIVLADQDGVVDMTASAIARRTSIPLEIIQLGVERLMAPDPESRTPDEDGRRITLVEDHRAWGWQIVNYAKYRDMRKAEDRREYLRIKQQESRSRRTSTSVNTASTKINTSTDEDTDTDTEAEVEAKKKKATPAPWLTIDDLIASGLTAETAQGFIDHRRAKKAKLTALAWKGFRAEVEKATGWTLEAACLKAIARNWISVEAAWLLGTSTGQNTAGHTNRQKAVEDSNRAVGRAWASKGADHAGQ